MTQLGKLEEVMAEAIDRSYVEYTNQALVIDVDDARLLIHKAYHRGVGVGRGHVKESNDG